MADGIPDYISSSLDPQAADVLQAQMAAQYAGDPSRIPAGLPPAATALAYINTGFGRQQAANIMGQLEQQRQAALPAIAQGMAAQDPAQWAAQYATTPGANQYALSRVLGGLSPTGVAAMRLQAAEAQHQLAGAAYEQAEAARLGITVEQLRRRFGAGGAATGGGAAGPGPGMQVVNDPNLFRNNPSGAYRAPGETAPSGDPAQAQAAQDQALLTKIPYGTGAQAWFAQQKPEMQKAIREAWARTRRPPPTAVAVAPAPAPATTSPGASA